MNAVEKKKVVVPIHGSYHKASQEFMISDLADSGLTPQDADFEASHTPPPSKGEKAISSYNIMYYDLNGVKFPFDKNMHRTRIEYRHLSTKDQRTKDYPKYKGPSADFHSNMGFPEAVNYPYIHPPFWTHGGDTVYILEGEKKALKFGLSGKVPAMAIPGCTSWSFTPNGGIRGIHPIIIQALEKKGCKKIVIVPDGDFNKIAINKEYGMFARLLAKRGYTVGVLDPSKLSPSKPDEYIKEHSFEEFLANAEFHDDLSTMIYDRRELVRDYNLHVVGQNEMINGIEANVDKLFHDHPNFAGYFWYDEDRSSPMLGDVPFDDRVDPFELTCILQDRYAFPAVKKAMVKAAIVKACFSGAHRSPLAEWLKSLDGGKDTDLLETWMIKYLGANDTPHVREVSKKFLVAAVARRLKPGCIVDYITLLLGPQGIGKSSVLRTLFGSEWTLEYDRATTQGKDGIQQLTKKWVSEDAEMDNLTKGDANSLKQFITKRTDTFRAPYDSVDRDHQRRFILVGTGNTLKFLKRDSTGYRRFAVVEVTKVDFAGIVEVREKLFAAALAQFYEYESSNDSLAYSMISTASEVAKDHVETNVLEEHVMQEVNDLAEEWRKQPAKYPPAHITIDKEKVAHEWLTNKAVIAVIEGIPGVRYKPVAKDFEASMEMIGFRKVKNIWVEGIGKVERPWVRRLDWVEDEV